MSSSNDAKNSVGPVVMPNWGSSMCAARAAAVSFTASEPDDDAASWKMLLFVLLLSRWMPPTVWDMGFSGLSVSDLGACAAFWRRTLSSASSSSTSLNATF